MLQIVFNKDLYKPGDDLKAYITLNIPNKMDIEYGLLNLNYTFKSRESGHNYRKVFIDEKIDFIQPGVYPSGIYNYTINYKIPNNIPPSFRGRLLEGVLEYRCVVGGVEGFTVSRSGHLILKHESGKRSEESLYAITSGDVHLNLLLDDPVKGRVLRGVLSIEEGKDKIKRLSIDLCLYEGYKSQRLLILKNFRESTRCFPLHRIVVSRGDLGRYPFRADLGRLLVGHMIYTSPYSDEDMSFKTYLRLRIYTRDGERTYFRPINWYPYEDVDPSYVEKEVVTMEEKIRRMIIEYFQSHEEGDIIDVMEYLDLKGFNVNIHMLERLFNLLLQEGVIREADENPVLKRYRLNL